MIIDEKGKLFGKISIVDLLFLLVIVVAVCGSVVMVSKIKDKTVMTENRAIVSVDSGSLEVKMLVRQIRDISVESLEVGDDVYESENNKYLGEITAIDAQPATQFLADVSGKAHLAEIPQKYDVMITVKVPGKQTDSGFYSANNQHLVYGSQFGIKTVKLQTTPVIQEVRTLEEAK